MGWMTRRLGTAGGHYALIQQAITSIGSLHRCHMTRQQLKESFLRSRHKGGDEGDEDVRHYVSKLKTNARIYVTVGESAETP